MVYQPRESVASAAIGVEPQLEYDEEDAILENLEDFMRDLYKWFSEFEKGLDGENWEEEMAKYDVLNGTWEEEFQEWFLED